MHISVIASARDVHCEIIEEKNVVIIDVLRATSVIVTALANKAEYIIPMESIEKAQAYFRDNESKHLVLCGERDTKIIAGFHFGNSPLSYTKENINGKIIIQTTSNGTRTIKACDKGLRIYIASFLNVEAIVNQLLYDKTDTVIVCSGTNNQYSMDDALCAGMIISLLEQKAKISMTDLSWGMKEIYEKYSSCLYSFLSKACSHFKVLQQNGFKEDLNYCLQQNVYNIVPVYSQGCIRILKQI